jgi:hypothetical protein
VNPPLLGMRKVLSEDSVRRGMACIHEAKGLPGLQNHLEYCTTPRCWASHGGSTRTAL